ncbi:MAG: helix-turn-helix domain-containing protein [Desulfatibacillaceae bacterium]
MPSFFEIASAFVTFSCGLAFLMALEQMTRKKPDRLNFLVCVLLACGGLLIAQTTLVGTGRAARHPFAMFPMVAVIFAMGPLNLLYYNALIHQKLPTFQNARWHFAPALVVLVFEVVFQFRDAEIKRMILEDLVASPTDHLFSVFIVLGAAHVLTYLLYLLGAELAMGLRFREVPEELRLISLTNVIVIMSTVLLVVGFLSKVRVLFLVAGTLIGLVLVASFLGRNRYPYFFQVVRREIQQKKYERSLLTGVDTEGVAKRLVELMERDKVYQDVDISLKSLADMLGLTPQQLSQFLNERMAMDFRNYVNKYRIGEATRQLVDDPDKGILNICFDVGFSSKSSFNTAFKKFTGKTPREYRTENVGEVN